LRGPTLKGKAFIVAIDADKPFGASASISKSDVHNISVQLGLGRGIRDLARLDDGQIADIERTGQDAVVSFEIYVLDIVAEASELLGTLGELPDVTRAKAEAISALSPHERH